MNGDAPATKTDLQQLKDELIEAMRGIETSLLRAFSDYNHVRAEERAGSE